MAVAAVLASLYNFFEDLNLHLHGIDTCCMGKLPYHATFQRFLLMRGKFGWALHTHAQRMPFTPWHTLSMEKYAVEDRMYWHISPKDFVLAEQPLETTKGDSPIVSK